VAELETSTSTFYGRIKKNGSDFFASIDAHSGYIKLLGKLTSIASWVRKASALDSDKNRFFLAASHNRKECIITIEIETGEVIRSVPLSHPIKAFDYDPDTEKLLGLARIDGAEKFVSIDPGNGKVDIRSDLSSVNQTYSSVFMDSHHHRLYFIGIQKGRDAAWEVDTGTGSLRKLASRSVGLNEHLVHSFKETGVAEAIFTAGVQSCIGIAGHNVESQIGFIAHYTAGFPEIESSLIRIDRELREKYGLQGLIDMRFWVVGGVREMPASVHTLHNVYSVLIESFGVDFDEITKFNTGVSYHILNHEGAIVVF
jgi:hypothetical protein